MRYLNLLAPLLLMAPEGEATGGGGGSNSPETTPTPPAPVPAIPALPRVSQARAQLSSEEQAHRIAELEQQVRDRQTKVELRQEMTQLESKMDLLLQANQRAEQEKQALRLDAYKARKIGELTGAGTGFLPERITGTTEAEIDAAVTASVAEYARLEAMFRAKLAPQQAAAPAAPTAPVGTQFIAPPGPGAFPTVPASQPVTEAGADVGNWNQQIKQATSPDAVRSGDWKKNREAVMSQLRASTQGVMPPGGAFMNQPRVHVSTLQVPQGLPTPPAHNPQTALAPPVPQALPHQEQPSGLQPPTPAIMPGQPAMATQVAQSQIQHPTGLSAEQMAAARAAAERSAQQGLTNPQSQQAQPTRGAPAKHAEYQGTPNQNARFVTDATGRTQHPMHRQSV